MKYTKGHNYKYKSADTEVLIVDEAFRPYTCMTDFITLKDCVLTIQPNFCWDGASGPTVDTKNTIVPSQGHDALAQLIREGHIPFEMWIYADKDLYKWLRERKMSSLRLWAWEFGLSKAKGSYAKPKTLKKVHYAP